MERNRIGLTTAAWLLGFASCASVCPAPDYDLAVDEIRSATGSEGVFHPESDPAATAHRVEQLLSDGLGLSEAVEIGLLNNPALQAEFRKMGMAHADRVQAGLLKNPSLGAALRFSSGGANEFEGGLFASLFDVLQRPKRERIAEYNLQRETLQLANRAALLASDIRGAYLKASSADRLFGIAQENLLSAKQLSDLASARLDAAAGTAIDANLARVEWLETEVAVRDATLASGEAHRRLCLLLGLELNKQDMELTEPWGESSSHLLPLDELEKLALAKRLDIRAAKEAVKQAAADVERQKSLFTRNIDVGLVAEEGDGWSIGPGIEMALPILDQNEAQIAKATEALARQESILVAIQLLAKQEVNSAVARVQASQGSLAIYREDILTCSEKALSQARESYQLGKTTMFPALEAQRKLLATRSALAHRSLQAASALSDLERATGTSRENLHVKHTEEEEH